MNDTITAISTTLGLGAISIIRVSGKDAIEKKHKNTWRFLYINCVEKKLKKERGYDICRNTSTKQYSTKCGKL